MGKDIHRIQEAAVLGAGVMGSAIAAHLAGAGIKVHLLDIVPPDLKDNEREDSAARNRFAQSALAKTLKAKPAAFYSEAAARLVEVGNFEDDMPRLAQCDLVVEAVLENLDIKRSIFAQVAAHAGPETIVASNTSGLSVASMNEVLPESLQERFLVMHFFNPVRYMRLLELVPGPNTRPEVMEAMAAFGEYLGKGIVYGKDTTNFVANRIGVYGLMASIHKMEEHGLTIEEVDKILGKPTARPRSAAYKTCDIVGIDTMIHVAKNCYDNLTEDEARETFKMPAWVEELVAGGAKGRKSGAGFYKKVGKDVLVYDPSTKDYREQKKVRFESLGAAKGKEDAGERLSAVVWGDDAAAKYAWDITANTLAYAARRVGEIADDIVNIDRAMRWGFNWELGPFEMWDAIGFEKSLSRMKEEGIEVPQWVTDAAAAGRSSFYKSEGGDQSFLRAGEYHPVPTHPKQLSTAAIKADKTRVVESNMGASLIDLGEGVLGVEVHTKMNTLDTDVIAMLGRAVEVAESGFRGILIGNDGEHFGAGANILLVMMAAQQKQWDQIQALVGDLQMNLQRLRYAPVPVVAAPFSLTLGGACEVAMAADACQAFAETYMGLVEVGVGLVPAGGGCMRAAKRYSEGVQEIEGADLLPHIGQASLNIAMAKVATGAEDAQGLRYLRSTDGISLNRDFLLHDARARVIGMAEAGYRPPRPGRIRAAGRDAAATIGARVWGLAEGGFASEHDALIANKIAHILCGGDVAAGTWLPEEHYLDLEKEAFLSLCGEEKTMERIQHMLMTNKPLRN